MALCSPFINHPRTNNHPFMSTRNLTWSCSLPSIQWALLRVQWAGGIRRPHPGSLIQIHIKINWKTPVGLNPILPGSLFVITFSISAVKEIREPYFLDNGVCFPLLKSGLIGRDHRFPTLCYIIFMVNFVENGTFCFWKRIGYAANTTQVVIKKSDFGYFNLKGSHLCQNDLNRSNSNMFVLAYLLLFYFLYIFVGQNKLFELWICDEKQLTWWHLDCRKVNVSLLGYNTSRFMYNLYSESTCWNIWLYHLHSLALAMIMYD